MEGEVVGIQEGRETAEVALERPRVGRTDRWRKRRGRRENVWKTMGELSIFVFQNYYSFNTSTLLLSP
jgi:hypothetical protein